MVCGFLTRALVPEIAAYHCCMGSVRYHDSGLLSWSQVTENNLSESQITKEKIQNKNAHMILLKILIHEGRKNKFGKNEQREMCLSRVTENKMLITVHNK